MKKSDAFYLLAQKEKHFDDLDHFKNISPRRYDEFMHYSLPRLYIESLVSMKGHFSRNELMFILECFKPGYISIELGLVASIIEEASEEKDWEVKWCIDKEAVIEKINTLDYFQLKFLEIWMFLFFKQFNENDEAAALYINDLL